MAAVPALRAVVDALGAANVLPVKGVVTGRTLYADPSERELSDIDVRVRGAGDLERALAYAKRDGHFVRKHSRAYGTVVLEVMGTDVDIETNIGAPGFCSLEVRDMFARATLTDDVFGFPCLVPDVHDHALLLAVNAFKDKLVLTPEWSLEDVVRIAESESFDVTRFVDLAAHVDASELVWIVADWVAPRSRVWRSIREAIGPEPPRRLYARLHRLLVNRSPTSMAMRVLSRLVSDDPRARLVSLAHAVWFSSGG